MSLLVLLPIVFLPSTSSTLPHAVISPDQSEKDICRSTLIQPGKSAIAIRTDYQTCNNVLTAQCQESTLCLHDCDDVFFHPRAQSCLCHGAKPYGNVHGGVKIGCHDQTSYDAWAKAGNWTTAAPAVTIT
jgi:hypothetical protein